MIEYYERANFFDDARSELIRIWQKDSFSDLDVLGIENKHKLSFGLDNEQGEINGDSHLKFASESMRLGVGKDKQQLMTYDDKYDEKFVSILMENLSKKKTKEIDDEIF